LIDSPIKGFLPFSGHFMMEFLLKKKNFGVWLESSLDGMAITDIKGKILFSNPALEKLFGYAREELAELTVEDLMPERFRGRHREERAGYAEHPRSRPMGEGLDLFGLRKDGTEFPADISLILLEAEQGRFVLATVHDISRRKLAEKALANQTVRLRAILETAVDAIIVIDERGLIETFNPAAERMFGYTEAEVKGQSITLLMPSPYRDEHNAYIARYLRTGERRVIGIGREVLGLRRDGSTFPIELTVAETPLGNHRLFTGIIRDVTERRKAQEQQAALLEQLTEKNAELERFIYTASHDLKSPLITIQGFSGMLEQSATRGDFERMRGDIRRIRAAASRMQTLLEDLLELSRIGRVANPPEKVSMRALVHEAVELVRDRLPGRKLRTEISRGLPDAVGDPKRIFEVWLNLIENAVKFMGDQDEPLIEIGAEAREGEIVYFVRDNGIGIEPSYHTKIFGLFERLDPNTEGTGIGLAIVKRIVEVHGGSLWVDSEGQGLGCTFYFSLRDPA
jgi:two-component system sensor kinase FixL